MKTLDILHAIRDIWWRFLPHFLLISVQIGCSFLYFLVEAAFNHGLNPHVCVTYRYLVGSLIIFPFAFLFERKMRPKMTISLFAEINLLALLGASLNLNLYFTSLKYTSATFVTSMVNTVPAITFVTAIILRLEVVNLRNPRGIAKIIGTAISLAGAVTIGVYKGHEVESLKGAPIQIKSDALHKDWVKGAILLAGSCISWSLWFIFQAYTLKKYPAQLSLTVLINFLGAAQSAVFTAFLLRKPEVWRITFDIEFWSIAYAGVICSGLTILIQLWCTKQKGPVFVTMFSPLGTTMVAILAYCLFGEDLRMGSVVGGAIAIVGLYVVLWGKEGDVINGKKLQQQCSSMASDLEEKKNDIQISSG